MPTCGMRLGSVLAFSVLAIAAEAACGQETEPPLPAGAIARLGTTRLQAGGTVTHLAFSPDGKRLASWSTWSLVIWDVATGRELRRVDTRVAWVYALAWPAERRGVAVVMVGEGKFYIWDFADENADPLPPDFKDGKRVGIYEGDERGSRFALSPDCEQLAVCLFNKSEPEPPIVIRELATGKRVEELKQVRVVGKSAGECTGLVFTSDGKSLVSFSRESIAAKEEQLIVWDVATGRERKRMTVSRITQRLHNKDFALARDGRYAALATLDAAASLWDLERGVESHAIARHGGESVTAVAFSPNGRMLASAGRDRTTRLSDVTSGKEIWPPAKEFQDVDVIAFSPDGARIATGGRGGRIRICDAATGADACPLDTHLTGISSLAFSPDGRTVVTASLDHTARLWDANTGQHKLRIDLGQPAADPAIFTPDGKAVLVAVGEGKTIPMLSSGWKMFDTTTGQALPRPGALANAGGRLLAFSGDGRTLLTGEGRVVTQWDWPVGKRRSQIELRDDDVDPEELVAARVSPSPDGRLLAVSVERQWKDGLGRFGASPIATEIWDSAAGRRLHRLDLQGSYRTWPHFLPDGRTLFLTVSQTRAAADKLYMLGTFSLWDPVAGRMRGTFPAPKPGQMAELAHEGAMALSPDGRMLATPGSQGIALYETATGGVRRRLKLPWGTPFRLTFSPDGRRLATDWYPTLLVWDVSLATASPDAPAGPLTEPEKNRLWRDLALHDAEPAYQAMCRLARFPEAAAALIRRNLPPARGADDATLDRLFVELGSDQFETRERALTNLDVLGEAVITQVRARLPKVQSPEVRRRVKQFLEKHESDLESPDRLRELRALELLEQLATPEARTLLGELAKGSAAARRTHDAAAALQRIERNAGERPGLSRP